MSRQLTVGDFSRMTHLTVKTLRHYHDVGLLEPAEIDAATNYRYYAPEQIPQAQVIRRLRDLDMPVAEIKAVLATPDAAERNALIARHLDRLESELARTRSAVDSLRAILERPATPHPVVYRTVVAARGAAIQATIDSRDISAWWPGAIAELSASVRAQGAEPAGPVGGLYDAELFQHGRGHAVIFIPIRRAIKPVGRIEPFTVPAAELAIVTHAGSHTAIDAAYGDLGAHVAAHEIGVDGPIREYYLRNPHDHPDAADWITEIGWPIFRSDASERDSIDQQRNC